VRVQGLDRGFFAPQTTKEDQARGGDLPTAHADRQGCQSGRQITFVNPAVVAQSVARRAQLLVQPPLRIVHVSEESQRPTVVIDLRAVTMDGRCSPTPANDGDRTAATERGLQRPQATDHAADVLGRRNGAGLTHVVEHRITPRSSVIRSSTYPGVPAAAGVPCILTRTRRLAWSGAYSSSITAHLGPKKRELRRPAGGQTHEPCPLQDQRPQPAMYTRVV